MSVPAPSRKPWITATILGIVLATFFSDVSHEMATAVLPLFLASAGLGAVGLGIIEGIANFLVSMSKLAGGIVGHRVRHKRPVAALGYLLTAVATAAIGLAHTLAALVTFRSLAWIARGFRGPLRDYLLADEVEKTHYGRAYGLERAGDMVGAVTGPLLGALLVWAGLSFGTVILWTLVPGVLAASAMFFMTRDRPEPTAVSTTPLPPRRVRDIPRGFWLFLVGVFFFGLGDFSRTFLVWLAIGALHPEGPIVGGEVADVLTYPVLLLALHNLISAVAAFPVGQLGDRRAKLPLLAAGYSLGIVTNLILAVASGQLAWLIVAIVLSGIYIAVEETLEKATAAEMLPRELRSLGFGILASVNAVGDMVSSLLVGFALGAGRPDMGFGLAAGLGFIGVVWLALLSRRLAMANREW